MSAALVDFPTVSNDIPAALRKLADRVEAGEFPDIKFIAAVVVEISGERYEYTTFGWGSCSPLEAAGAFARSASSF